MLRWLVLLLSICSLCLSVSGCSDDIEVERSATECADGRDNDGDQLIDCDDPDCRARPFCASAKDGGGE
jgi:hypothetical protein